jgi:hypothetical protein
MAGQQAARPGINADLDIDLEPGAATRVDHALNATGCGLIVRFQF